MAWFIFRDRTLTIAPNDRSHCSQVLSLANFNHQIHFWKFLSGTANQR
ncbi:MAG: hypothetical protein MUF49_28670 [Oculatellaceae cyanobacterium Prado106]|nr:hypothetical protein [Oculatellaceae cyanobacterium Prado106]